MPAVHPTHVWLLVAPVTLEEVPKGQRVQLREPASEYVPMGQVVQFVGSDAPDSGEYFPGRQSTQAWLDTAPR